MSYTKHSPSNTMGCGLGGGGTFFVKLDSEYGGGGGYLP